MHKVFLRELEFYAYHGVSREERAIGHRYTASVTVSVAGDATTSDSIGGTVDYGAIAGIVQRVGTTSKCSTVERLAYSIARELLDAFESIEEAQIRVSKRLPPMPYIASEAGVELTLRRSDASG